MSLFEELKRRNVFRVGVAYVLLGWVVLQGADFALDLIDAPNWIIQALFIIGLVGLPFALFFAWAFELTPEGIKREEDVDRSGSIAPVTGRKLDRAIIAFLVVAVLLLLGDRWFQTESPHAPASGTVAGGDPAAAEADAKSIAVLPFVNMSSDQEQEYFSDGISEEILNALAQVQGLKVAGRTSSFAFKGRNQDLRTIGETLGVNHILEGSVRKAGDRVRITAQLIKADDGFHLWSETFDRELTDVFAIQDEIAAAILEEMETQLAIGQNIEVAAVDLAVYDQYLQARQLSQSRGEADLERAAALLDEVIAQDPDYAPALALRAAMELMLSDKFGHYGSIPHAEALDTAENYLERAYAIDPDDPDVLAGRGAVFEDRGELEKAEANLARALELNPNHTNALNWLAGLYGNQGKLREQLALRERLYRVDPLYAPATGNLATMYATLGDPARMQSLIDETLPLLDGATRNYVKGVAAWASIMRGQEAEAIRRIDALPAGERGWGEFAAGIGYARLLEYERALPYVDGQPAMVWMLGRLGRTEEAMQLGKRLLEGGQGLGAYIGVLAEADRYEEIVTLVESRFETLEDFVQRNGGGATGASPIGEVVYALRMTGREADASRLLALYLEALERQRREGADNMFLSMSLAQLALLERQPELALDQLQRAVDQGFMDEMSRYSRIFGPLRGEPRFEALVERVNERRNEQRALLGMPPAVVDT
ncbi:MAG: tetratricopeptide repeat protein [Gammaproteobacteria bacterium]